MIFALRHTMQKHLQHGCFAMLTMVMVLGGFVAPSVFATETLTYYHTDTAGSPVMTSDQNGNVVWRETYRPYGDKQRKTNPAEHAGFIGKPFEVDFGLSYLGARWYDPALGRFMGVDPALPSLTDQKSAKESIENTNPNDLHSFNRYAYANNNPYKFTDISGAVVIYIGGIGIVSGGPLTTNAGGGFVFDNHGNWGTYKVNGVGGGASTSRGSFGLTVGVMISTVSKAPATTIFDFGGPFANGSVGAGFGPSASVDGFYDPYTPANKGGGVTIGAGVGGGVSLGPTNTVVTPNTLTWRDLVPDFLLPNGGQ